LSIVNADELRIDVTVTSPSLADYVATYTDTGSARSVVDGQVGFYQFGQCNISAQQDNFTVGSPAMAPEPASGLLLVAGAAGLGAAVRRRRVT